VPDRIERVMPAGPPAAVLLYTIAPEKMIGWPHSPGPAAKSLLGPGFADLPQLTPLVRDCKVQTEQIQAARPDVILDYGSTAPRYVDRATMVQETTGIPVVLLDGRLERTPEIYRLLGGMLGTEERAADLAGAAERLLTITRERAEARREAGPGLSRAGRAVRLDRRAALGQSAARTFMGGSYALSGGLPGGSAGRSPGFLLPVLPDRARRRAIRGAVAVSAIGRTTCASRKDLPPRSSRR
jgi:iron complex transport system substrate-binding protein